MGVAVSAKMVVLREGLIDGIYIYENWVSVRERHDWPCLLILHRVYIQGSRNESRLLCTLARIFRLF